MKTLIFAATCFLLAGPYGFASADNSDAAYAAGQTARAEGIAAFRAGDLTTALTKMEEALSHRPGNAAILSNILYLAAETGNLTRAEEAAYIFAAKGIAPGAPFQAKLKEKLSPEVWAKVEAKFLANSKRIGAADIIASLSTNARLVEGIAVTNTGDLLAATVASGSIYKVAGSKTSSPRESLLVEGKKHGMASFFGVAYASKSNTLYATYAQIEQSPQLSEQAVTGLAAFDAETGTLRNNWVLGSEDTNHQIADIVLTPAGEIYVSDAQGKAVYHLGKTGLELAFDLPLSVSPQGLAYKNGMLYLADYGRGIWKLDPETGSASILPAPENSELLGIDGLTNHKGALFAIQNGINPHRILKLSIGGSTISDVAVVAQALPGFDEPTLGVSTKDGYYFVASSQWPKYGTGASLREGVTLSPTLIMKLH